MSRVLIVDDEPDYLDELVEALGFAGLPAGAALRGIDALSAVRSDPEISVILTDIRMPDMDGVALIHAMNAAFPERDLAFLVMTGHAAEVDLERAHAAGAARCFPKPLAFDALCHALVELENKSDDAS